ncbi:DUF2785 domain-containing protein [Thalassobacillus hwangdonensis]|uniref:DUF2785 domain-containing protein n=1 Tax=Thalassobacillus hwangdonensis TaxID=546108 RepID=A0ABW3L1L8_9BACI
MKKSLRENLLNENELKSILTEFKQEKIHWQDIDQSTTLNSMIEHIGSTDSVLRDQLIYDTFFRLMVERDQIETERLSEILDMCINEKLFTGIGENGTDTVFTRSFTTLVTALILYKDNQQDFLSEATINRVKEQLVKYYELEEDLRGYVTGKGWAHSVAHVTDAFVELVKNSKFDKEEFPEIMRTLWQKVLVSSHAYVHQEDERLLHPILEMLDKGLEVHVLEDLMDQLPDELAERKDKIDYEEYLLLVFNVKTFLKTFYVKINNNPKLSSLQMQIEQTLEKVR